MQQIANLLGMTNYDVLPLCLFPALISMCIFLNH